MPSGHPGLRGGGAAGGGDRRRRLRRAPGPGARRHRCPGGLERALGGRARRIVPAARPAPPPGRPAAGAGPNALQPCGGDPADPRGLRPRPGRDAMTPGGPRASSDRRVLILGSFVPWTAGSRAPSEDLGERLATDGWEVILRSRRRTGVARLLDLVTSAWRLRARYALALVDVHSGAAFRLAEAACWTLRRAKRPYVLLLHGGALPAFARRWPGRVRRLVESAALVTAPSRYLV